MVYSPKCIRYLVLQLNIEFRLISRICNVSYMCDSLVLINVYRHKKVEV